MIITVKNQNVYPGWLLGHEPDRTTFHDSSLCSGLLVKLNSVIDWEKSKFPMKTVVNEAGDKTTEEDRKFLGEVPELKPGNTFEWDSGWFAIDSDEEIYLINSKTGARVSDRFIECLNQEYEMRGATYPEDLKVEVTELTEIPDLDNFEKVNVPLRYALEKLPGNALFRKVTLSTESYDYPIEFILLRKNLYWEKDCCLDEISAKFFTKMLISWCLSR